MRNITEIVRKVNNNAIGMSGQKKYEPDKQQIIEEEEDSPRTRERKVRYDK